MTSNNGHGEQNNSSGFSDETIRRFLFGQLSESEQPLFERQLFADTGLETRVRLAEIDLADDYAFERLTAADRALFEERFLVTSRRRRGLGISTALRDRFASVKPPESTVAKRWKYLVGFERPTWRIAFGVLVLLVLFGTVLLVVKEPRLTARITNKIIPRRSPARSVPREMNHPTNTSSPEHQTTPAPMPLHDQASSSSVTLVLTPTGSPDNSNLPSVNLPPGDQDVLRVQLTLKPDQTGPYRAELLTADGQSVLNAESIKVVDGENAQIGFEVAARLLKTGSYQIRVSRNKSEAQEIIGSYYFRVQ